MNINRSILVIICFLFCSSYMTYGQDLINDTDYVNEVLVGEKKKNRAIAKANTQESYKALKRLLAIGDWDFVLNSIKDGAKINAIEKAELKSLYLWLNNDFAGVENELKLLSQDDQHDFRIQRILATLDIEAWKLEDAERRMLKQLNEYPKDRESSLVLGRALLLQKKYREALSLADAMISYNDADASGYFLKAEVYFWDQRPKEAEENLVKGLRLDPLNADARFYYGYAIWRRIDATQLDDMVAQWDLALNINQLHYQTHWHLGNGHTNRTYADYVDEHETEIRKALDEADSLFSANKLNEALEVISAVEREYVNSVLPAMHRASLLYSDFDNINRSEQLDKAQDNFIHVLSKKKHYGPAHNGLAAVLKSKRIPYLSTYETIMGQLRSPDITNMDDFLEVFPDVGYYPGNVAKGMAWNQLYTSVVYFPFLVKQHRAYVIPPLHIDLALAMKAPYFRFNTTFDNRQWMDIRGVGSGAAAIEYVERGAFEERNVLLHEYVHLFHSQVTTDEQNRRIKQLYYQAMENGLTLDYYSQNNESEYFAQTYPAYFEKVKVHPLDFKSMNTLSDLKSKDPEMYAFLDELVAKERAYLSGDKSAMASNWAQVYLNLASKAGRIDLQDAYVLLDTALQYDSKYIPAHLRYAEFLTRESRFTEAESFIDRAKSIDSLYAPIYSTEAYLVKVMFPDAFDKQAYLLRKAYDLEDDYMEKATAFNALRNFYYNRGLLEEALAVAEEYILNASEISTYLRDRKNEAKAFKAYHLGLLGDNDSENLLAYLVSQKPQNYALRTQYVEVLLASKDFEGALKNMLPLYRTLQASQVNRPEFELLIAEAYIGLGEKKEGNIFLDRLTSKDNELERLDVLSNLRLVRLLLKADRGEDARKIYEQLAVDDSIFYKSSFSLTNALLKENEGDVEGAVDLLINSLNYYNYQGEAIQMLYNLSKTNVKAEKVFNQYMETLVIKPVL
ncbi:hypothetical protein ORI89_09830 [Sphingobacterium sp. UT-1RO-CII-1]|uniref:tetratricopeptide repeat protein n=1 Tax=Sphingobacterium sp. UT-1RO-CII-1 TaxID=2995225 RepID=UPI00227C7C1A|nr:tetratricopeptide repeat protein [Sphingobacterium sp. UT-1RO-CII-1]MCY4779949.1 hypothetical protein [Sphingobacterium sp. UT-1RO-CII-1]